MSIDITMFGVTRNSRGRGIPKSTALGAFQSPSPYSCGRGMCIAHAQSVLFVADIDILTIARENGCCDACLRFQRAMVSQWDTSRRRRVEWGSAYLHWVSGVIAGEHLL